METALRKVDRGVVEVTQAMGANTWQIIRHTLLPAMAAPLFWINPRLQQLRPRSLLPQHIAKITQRTRLHR